MAGIGDYKKGGKFTLRSGNSPLAFKNMGSSPFQKEEEFPGLLPEVNVKASEHQTTRDNLARQALPQIYPIGGTLEDVSQGVRSKAYQHADEYLAKNKKARKEDAVKEDAKKDSPIEGKLWDAVKKGDWKGAKHTLKQEGKAWKAALLSDKPFEKGLLRHKDERGLRADPVRAYYSEKQRQREVKAARKALKPAQKTGPVPTKEQIVKRYEKMKK